jgi:hypothetical protein
LFVEAINAWEDPNPDPDKGPRKIKWEDLENDIAKFVTGRSYTRQALKDHKDIYDAYKAKAKGLRPKSEKDLQIERLQKAMAELQKENTWLLARFLKWSYNARKAATLPVRQDTLDRPLPNPTSLKRKK